jgi:hypothetical protein
MDIGIHALSMILKTVERTVLGPAAANKAEAETRSQQVPQCERCPITGRPFDVINLSRA